MHLSRFAAWSGLACAALAVQTGFAAPGQPLADARGSATSAFGNVRMAFEPNRGQADSSVRYVSRGRGYGLLLRDREAVLALSDGKGITDAIGFQWLGTGRPDVRAENPTGGVSNYFTAKLQQADIPHFGRVRHGGLYPGIDLVYYGTERELEYDLIVRPGADPSQARFRVAGAQAISLVGGDLHIGIGERDIVHRKPFVYQMNGGVRQRVAGEYVLLSRNEVGFRIGQYDRKRELVIDPVVAYTIVRGSSNLAIDEATAIAVDAGGNAYVGGYTTGSDFPTVSPGQNFGGGDADGFVMKINPSGTAVVFATFLGGSGADVVRGIAVDTLGSAYIVGETLSTNMPVFAPLRTVNKGSSDGFLVKLTPAGNQVVYGTFIGGTLVDRATAVAVDGSRNAYVTGWTTSTDLNEVTRTDTSKDAFLVRVNAAGTAITTVYRGGTGADQGWAVAVDTSGNVYIAGDTTSTNLAGAAFQSSKRGTADTTDGFIAKFDVNLTPVYWAYLGGDSDDSIRGIATDSGGSVYVTGMAGAASNFPVVGGLGMLGGGIDGFVAKLNSLGTAILYSTLFGGEAEDTAFGIAVDANGSAHVAGRTVSNAFPRIQSAKSTTPGGTYDAFVIRLNAAGNGLIYSTLLGGSKTDVAEAIALDSAGSAYIAGFTLSPEVHGRAANEQDAFVMKLNNSCTFAVTPGSIPFSAAGQFRTVTIDTAGDCTWSASATGSFLSIVGATSGTGPATLTISAQANPGLARSGSLTVAGQTIPVTQTGSVSAGCSYSLSSPGTSVSSAATRSTFTLNTTSTCGWEAYSSASWLQIFPLSGTGTATLSYSVFPNFTPAARSATITAGGQTFTVSQAANTMTADQRFVQLAYFSAFGRLPSPDELNFQVTNGLANKDYAGLVLNFLNSQEFNMGGRFVAGLYVGLLDRNAEFGGWQFQRDALTQAIVSPQSLVNNFLSGAEYALRFGTPDNREFVRLLYRYVLLREGTTGEVDFQSSQLQPTGNATRADLAINFLTSNEFRQGTGPRLTAFLLYATLLLRDPSAAEIQSRIVELTGATQDTIKQVIAGIIQSGEFRGVVGWQ